MPQTADVDAEPLKWPIAPDGYIPNSVIRSWRRKGKDPSRTDSLLGLHWAEEEEENERDRKERDQTDRKREEDEKKEEEDEKNTCKKQKMQGEGKERREEEEVTEEDETDMFVTLKQSRGLQTQTMKKQKTLDDTNVGPQKPEAKSRYSTNNVDNTLLPPCDENGHKPLTESNECEEIYKTVTPAPPLHLLSMPKHQRTSSFIPKGGLEPPVESPVVSAASKQEFRHTTPMYQPSSEPQHRVPPPLMAPSPSPDYPQPPSVPGHPEPSPVKDQMFLLSSAKYDNIQKQVQVTLDQKALALYKKSKVYNKKSPHTEMSSIAKRHATSKATHSSIQNNTLEMSLNSRLFDPQAYSASQPWALTYSEGLELNSGLDGPSPLFSEYLAQFYQSFHPIEGNDCKPWRKNLYKLISLHGFRSPRAAKLPATEKSPNVTQLVATTPSLQTGQGATHQRVVEKIQMEDSLEPASDYFCHVIPMASQQTFFTLNTRGKTQYGRLLFDWMRGSEEEKLLNVSLVKPNNCR